VGFFLGGAVIGIGDAHGYGKRFIVRADEMLELERAIHEFAVSFGRVKAAQKYALR
jgi:hypothetical protein